MWSLLKPSDLARAQQELALRRAETLQRHLEDLAGLEADRAVVENLDRLAAAFCRTYRGTTSTAAAAATPQPAVEPRETEPRTRKSPGPAPEEAPRQAEPEQAAPPPPAKPAIPIPAILSAREKAARDRPAPAERRNLSGTNFDIFRRAVSKSTF